MADSLSILIILYPFSKSAKGRISNDDFFREYKFSVPGSAD